MRTELHVSINRELDCIKSIAEALKRDGYNASNSIVVTVSTDYSSIAGQIIRHELTHEGEIADGFGVDVPYPDQQWDTRFVNEACSMFLLHREAIGVKTVILVEAGVIRGGNYKFLTEWIFSNYPKAKVNTLTLFENTGSAFKSDFVGEYYDDKTQDLTFSWEKDNNHWNK
jgi:hypothetical protein